MTGFENNLLRQLTEMKARELENTENNEAEALARELHDLIKRIYAHQNKIRKEATR